MRSQVDDTFINYCRENNCSVLVCVWGKATWYYLSIALRRQIFFRLDVQSLQIYPKEIITTEWKEDNHSIFCESEHWELLIGSPVRDCAISASKQLIITWHKSIWKMRWEHVKTELRGGGGGKNHTHTQNPAQRASLVGFLEFCFFFFPSYMTPGSSLDLCVFSLLFCKMRTMQSAL